MNIKNLVLPKEWNIIKFKDIATKFIGGGTPSTKKEEYWNGQIHWMTSAILDKLYINKGMRLITKMGLNNSSSNLIPKNSIIISTRVGIGKIGIAGIDIAINQDLTGIIINHSKALTEYVYWALLNSKNKLINLSQGTTIKGIERDSLKNLRILLPPIPEQQQIVSILSNIDKLIIGTQKIIKSLQILKKGLMQHLFTEGIGHTEFKETKLGRIPESWDILPFNDIALDFLGGGTPSTKVTEYWDGNIPWITSGILTKMYINEGMRYITKEGLENSSSNLIRKGSLLISTRVGIGKVGIAGTDIAINQDLTGVIVDSNRALTEYLYWIFIKSQNKLLNIAQGTTVKGIERDTLKKLKIKLPPLLEQKEIMNIMKNIDNKIENEILFQNKLKKIKKGLMQDLLTGKNRVKLNN